jgi:Flp pilus assembly protein TadD
MATGLQRIQALLDEQDLDGARTLLEGLDPESLSAAELGRYCALRTAWLLLDGNDQDGREHLASALRERGTDLEFLRGCHAALARMTRPPRGDLAIEVGRQVARCEQELGSAHAAVRTLRRLVRDHPDEPGLLRELAACERADDDPDAAARTLQRYLRARPSDAAAWASLGDFYDDAGRFEEAEAAWQRAVALDPDDPICHYNRGVAAGRRRDLARVRSCLAALRRRVPDDPLALALSSILLEAEGQILAGWEAMQQAVAREADRGRAVALAHRALRYAERNALTEPARAMIDALHLRNLLDEDVLDVANRIEHPASTEAHDYSVLVDARPPAGGPRARYLRWLRVVADSADEALRLAVAFEQRCGGSDVRVDEVADQGAIAEADHVGVWQCQREPEYFPSVTEPA